MSTRGYIALVKQGKVKGIYNHYDSYLSNLGKNVINTIKSIDPDERINILNTVFDNIILVNSKDIPNQEQIKYMNDNDFHGDSDSNDWRSFLYELEGDLQSYIDGFVYMIDYSHYYEDKYCDYRYIIDLDSNKFKIYHFDKLKYTCDINDIDYKTIKNSF